jgi:hypothetical protein
MRPLLKISYRDLIRNRRRSLLTLVAIAVGVSLLVFMSGFIQGAIADSIENNIRLQTGPNPTTKTRSVWPGRTCWIARKS